MTSSEDKNEKCYDFYLKPDYLQQLEEICIWEPVHTWLFEI